MAATYEPIATTSGTGSSNSVTFSSIPSTYTDLRLVAFFKSTVGTSGFAVYFNGDTSALYSRIYLAGDGASGLSSRNTAAAEITCSYAGISTTIPTLTTVDVIGYTGSTNKSCLITTSADRNGGTGFTLIAGGLYRSTSAISSLTFKTDATAFTTDSKFTLFGIKNS